MVGGGGVGSGIGEGFAFVATAGDDFALVDFFVVFFFWFFGFFFWRQSLRFVAVMSRYPSVAVVCILGRMAGAVIGIVGTLGRVAGITSCGLVAMEKILLSLINVCLVCVQGLVVVGSAVFDGERQ